MQIQPHKEQALETGAFGGRWNAYEEEGGAFGEKRIRGSHMLVESEECSPEDHKQKNYLLLHHLSFHLAKTNDSESDRITSTFPSAFFCFVFLALAQIHIKGG